MAKVRQRRGEREGEKTRKTSNEPSGWEGKKSRKKILLNTKLLQCNMFIKKVFATRTRMREARKRNETSLKLSQSRGETIT
jgi:hypothetical protein